MTETDSSTLIAVVRSAGERTLDICRRLLESELSERRVHVIAERPFEKALTHCYEIGLQSGAEWMLTVDADVLVRPGAVGELLSVARELPPNFVQLEGLVQDKLKGGYRKAGHRIYRASLLHHALASIPAAGAEIRPEFSTLERLVELGYPSFECDVVFGVHDYEQYFRDLYRKAFVHGQKHPEWAVERVPIWRDHAGLDPDLRVALRGFCNGLESGTRARIDVGAYEDLAALALSSLGLTEKEPMRAEPTVLNRIETWRSDLLRVGPVREPRTRRERIGEAHRRLGPFRLLPYAAGSVLQVLGRFLQGLAGRK